MSFSYADAPPPESPPLRATPLSPAPPRRSTKRHTLAPNNPNSPSLTLDSLSLEDDILDLNARPRTSQSVKSVGSAGSGSLNRRASAMASIPVPKMINPLPDHYVYPQSQPQSQSQSQSPTTSGRKSSPAPSTTTHESTDSSSSSAASSTFSTLSGTARRKKSMPKLNTSIQAHAVTTGAVTSSDSEPQTPTSATISRSRGKSISRAVGKLASDLLSLNRHNNHHVPAVPLLRR